jgi:hypothetical protein
MHNAPWGHGPGSGAINAECDRPSSSGLHRHLGCKVVVRRQDDPARAPDSGSQRRMGLRNPGAHDLGRYVLQDLQSEVRLERSAHLDEPRVLGESKTVRRCPLAKRLCNLSSAGHRCRCETRPHDRYDPIAVFVQDPHERRRKRAHSASLWFGPPVSLEVCWLMSAADGTSTACGGKFRRMRLSALMQLAARPCLGRFPRPGPPADFAAPSLCGQTTMPPQGPLR